ncbi:MAG: tyrosine-type recombinase/integrase [Phenylobacterium sp.]|uniref:tyrosine-type recombinase/integrase n=1 Tax=Phenylobacterium sp. TaxID=1871053 RepID=UPI00271A4332|nr:site-specific integrase [Phenylobacterium sp.]MDO8910698.1 tyrosine-type recombinase/integrase [Phenylobacterium sp.]MDP3099052.1 tyrosine-type recombinase/integrase [Phenylobacterium sp.]
MARAREILTALAVEKFAKQKVADATASPPLWADGKQVAIRSLHDGGGLYLFVDGRRAEPGGVGTASWSYRYTFDGKARILGLGPFPDVTLEKARRKVADVRRIKADGQDPQAVRDAAKAARKADAARAVTFKVVAEDYIRANSAAWKNAKHADQWTATLETYAYPFIGEQVVGAVDEQAVLRVLRQPVGTGKDAKPLWEAKTETASRVRGRIEVILDYAKVLRLREGDNPAAWRGNLKLVLPARSKVQKVKPHEALPIDGMAEFMKALRTQDGVAARVLEFAIMTATRSGEARGASWGEIDLNAKIWTIPEQRMKSGREHRIPLSARAVEILEAAMPQDVDPMAAVFPGTRSGKPLSDMALTMLLRRMGQADVTAHGFRSTFRDWAAERTSYPRELAEKALAHGLKDKAEAAYQRSNLLEQRRPLMEAWARFCDGLVNVTALRAETAA